MDFWPFTRLRTYTPGAPVHCNDLNALQDATVRGKHGPLTVPIPLAGAYDIAGWTHDLDGLLAPSGGGAAVFTLPFAANTSVLAITAWWSLEGHPLQAAGASDVLRMAIDKRDPFAGTASFVALWEAIADDSIGHHANGRVRYRWQLDADPVHLQPGYLFRLSVSAGLRGRRLQASTATIVR